MSCHDCHKAGGWHLPLFSVAPKALSAVCLNGLKDFKGFKGKFEIIEAIADC